VSDKIQHPLSEALLNDYADEANEHGNLSAGKVSNLLDEVWHWRGRHRKLESEVANLRRATKELKAELAAKKSTRQAETA